MFTRFRECLQKFAISKQWPAIPMKAAVQIQKAKII